MDSLGKAIERNTELTSKACEQAAMMRAALSGEIKLFKVTLDAPNWDESDGAVIACRDRETLESSSTRSSSTMTDTPIRQTRSPE